MKKQDVFILAHVVLSYAFFGFGLGAEIFGTGNGVLFIVSLANYMVMVFTSMEKMKLALKNYNP